MQPALPLDTVPLDTVEVRALWIACGNGSRVEKDPSRSGRPSTPACTVMTRPILVACSQQAGL
jgi:hypothetical protein